MPKTYQEINEKIKSGQVVVVTAEEMIGIVEEEGAAKAAEQVDVVTTGTFGPMCSSGAFINTGHANPRIKILKAWLNDVPAYAGLAAVDLYIGATEMTEHDPLNIDHPGDFGYGGGHVSIGTNNSPDNLLEVSSETAYEGVATVTQYNNSSKNVIMSVE